MPWWATQIPLQDQTLTTLSSQPNPSLANTLCSRELPGARSHPFSQWMPEYNGYQSLLHSADTQCRHLWKATLTLRPLLGQHWSPTVPSAQSWFLPSPTGSMHLCAQSLQLCPTLWDAMNSSLSGSSVHGILRARILEWVAMASSRGSSQPRDRTRICCISCIDRLVLYH